MPGYVLSFWDKAAIYQTKSHPLMMFDLKQKGKDDRKEAGRQTEPCGHLSAGGPHACTRADNDG